LRYRPTFLSNLSNGLIGAIEKELDRLKLDPKNVFASYKGAWFGGEPMGGRQRKLVRDWGLEIFENTSLGDVVGATDCREHTGFHCWEDFALVEAIDPHGTQPVADGEIGELVVTSLTDDVSALVRYRTDDLVILNRARCGCGRTHMRLKLLGRKGDQVLVEGKSVMPMDIWPLVESEPESAAALFQLVRPQRELEVLHVRVGYNARLTLAPDALIRRLTAKFDEHLAVKVKIELIEEAELLRQGPPHKIPRVTKK
jgi:phenylacetate-CoA ligase